MIHLKQLIKEQSELSKLFGVDSDINNTDDTNANLTNVLFIGDSYVKSRNSYANKLIKDKVVSGKIAANSKMNIKKLFSLVKRISLNNYDIICITFGYMFNNEKNAITAIDTLKQLFKYLNDKGINLVIVNGIKGKNPEALKLINWTESEISNLVVDMPTSVNDHNRLLTDWVDTVNQEFNLNLSTELNTEPESDKEDSDDGDLGTSRLYPLSDIDINESVVNQAIELLKHFEAFSSKPYWDVSNWRIGFGSSTITRSSGEVIRLSSNRSSKPTETVTEDEALLDLNRRLKDEFIPATLRAIGGVSLPNNVVAALTSVVYNHYIWVC